MKNIRIGEFETNSSSTHSITFCTEQQFADFEAGKYIRVGENLYTPDEVRNMIRKNKWIDEDEKANLDNKTADELIDILGEGQTFDNWLYGYGVGFSEPWSKPWTTPGGEKIVAFGESGWDG